ncbi:hypothetical protein ACF0H5_002369 [Mactra antiquata]
MKQTGDCSEDKCSNCYRKWICGKDDEDQNVTGQNSSSIEEPKAQRIDRELHSFVSSTSINSATGSSQRQTSRSSDAIPTHDRHEAGRMGNLDDTNDYILRLEDENDKLQRYRKDFSATRQKQENEIKRINILLCEKTNEMIQLNEQHHADTRQLNKVLQDRKHDIRKLQEENASLLLLIQNNENKNDRSFNSYKRNQDIKVSELNMKLESALTSLEDKAKLINTLQSQNQVNLDKVKSLSMHLEEKEHDIQILKDSVKDLTLRCDEFQLEKQDNAKRVEELSEQIEQLQKILLQRDKELDHLKQEHDSLESQRTCVTVNTQRELTDRTSTIQVYCNGSTDISTKASQLFTECLQSHMSDLPVQIVQYQNPDDINPGLPTACLCVSVSRLGTDILKGMKHLEVNSNVVVIVLHYKEPHSLPTQSSRRVLVGEEYKHNVHAGMYDLGFQKHSIYDCDLNNSNMGDIVECLKYILHREGK